jgi:hypothetical protein
MQIREEGEERRAGEWHVHRDHSEQGVRRSGKSGHKPSQWTRAGRGILDLAIPECAQPAQSAGP